MRDQPIAPTEAARWYAAAYSAQYSNKDLLRALKLYRGIMASHPTSPEASFSRAQLGNIVKDVVPAQELLDATIAMALDHLESGRTTPD